MLPPPLGPLDRTSPGYIARPVQDRIVDAILRGDYINITGGPQTGKTTLLFSLQEALTSLDCCTAYVDLSPFAFEATQPEPWYQQMCNALHASLLPQNLRDSVPAPPTDHANLKTYLLQLLNIAPANSVVVLLMDEITGVPATLQRGFFSTIRSLFNARKRPGETAGLDRLVFVFAGTFSPDRLIESNNSPFNVATTFDTAEFDFAEVEVERVALNYHVAEAASRVYNLTSGHPYLTNALCSILGDGRGLDMARDEVLRDLHFRNLARRLGAAGDDAVRIAIEVAAGKSYGFIPGILPQLDELITMGIVKAAPDGQAMIRCELYILFLNNVRQSNRVQLPSARSPLAPVIFLPPGIMRDHAAALLEQLSITLSRQGVTGVGEPRDRVSGGDRLDRRMHCLH